MNKLLLTLLALAISIGAMAQNKCLLKGRVIDRPQSKILWASPHNVDIRVIDPVEVQIAEDGTFSGTIEFDESELYTLSFKDEIQRGSWNPIYFMLESGTVEFELYPRDDNDKNQVVGKRLNNKYQAVNTDISLKYRDRLESLYTKINDELGEDAYTAEYLSWIEAIQTKELSATQRDSLFARRDYLESNDMIYSEQGKAVREQITHYRNNIQEEMLAEIKKESNEATLASLSMLVSHNSYKTDMALNSLYKDILYGHFSKKFSSNPMYKRMETDILGHEIVVGADFVDFEAPDVDGRIYKLSELIEGRVVVLDLWASWCGPCMRTSKSFIPIWDKYRDRGFDIVGVARENNDTKAMVAAIERIGMKWLNLVELNDKGQIWAKYSAGNAGGKVILIDSEGKIVAMDFSASELEAHLERLLNDL